MRTLEQEILDELAGICDEQTMRSLEDAVSEVLGRYDEPHRHYHTREHLGVMLTAVRGECEGLPACPASLRPTVVLAALFHDAVYDPTTPDNEERSAVLAVETLEQLGVERALITEVERLVRCTAGHVVDAGDLAGVVLVDADLIVLAGDPGAYEAYRSAVRAEYAMFDDETWAAGRAAVLRSLLARPLLSPRADPALEARARANLEGELAGLRGR